MTPVQQRLTQLLQLVDKEDLQLQGVTARLFRGRAHANTESSAWLSKKLSSPRGIDTLESFVGKFSRMQDTVMDKLLPTFLQAVGESVGTALDNLNRAQRLGLVQNPDEWLAMRLLRNRLVHEYVDDIGELNAALLQARTLVQALHAAYISIKSRSSPLLS